MELADLRSRIDPDKFYVDFALLRAALPVTTLINDLQVVMSAPNREGECRGQCPKCGREKSFSLNTNSSRFNCFNKGCRLKGGGVIDFYAKLFEVTAKEASHLIAYAYGIDPYSHEMTEADMDMAEQTITTAKTETAATPISAVVTNNALPPLKPPEMRPVAVPAPAEREVTRPAAVPVVSANIPSLSPPPALTAQHLIASIEHQLGELKQLLTTTSR